MIGAGIGPGFLRPLPGAAVTDPYAVAGFKPPFVCDFAGMKNAGVEFYRAGDVETSFAALFPGLAITGLASQHDSAGAAVWRSHNYCRSSEDFATGWTTLADGITVVQNAITVDNDEKYGYIYSTNLNPGPRVTVEVDVISDTTVDDIPMRILGGSGGRSVLVDMVAGVKQRIALTMTNGTGSNFGIGIDTRDAVVPGGSDATGYTVTFTRCQIRNADLPMMPNPDNALGAGYEAYVPNDTTGHLHLARRNHHHHDGGWTNDGLRWEPAAATQLLHGTDALPVQTETVSAQAYTLSFRGSGQILLDGAHSALVVGAGPDAWVEHTFTPAAGELTITPSGSIQEPQLETGTWATSYIANHGTSGSVIRAAETDLETTAHGLVDGNLSVQVSGRWGQDVANADYIVNLQQSGTERTGLYRATANVNAYLQNTSFLTNAVAFAAWSRGAPFNMAWQVDAGSEFLVAAVGESAATPTAQAEIVSLAGATLQLGRFATNRIAADWQLLRGWNKLLGADGLEEATA